MRVADDPGEINPTPSTSSPANESPGAYDSKESRGEFRELVAKLASEHREALKRIGAKRS